MHRPTHLAYASDKEAEFPLEATAKLFDLWRNNYLPSLHLGDGLNADDPVHVVPLSTSPCLVLAF